MTPKMREALLASIEHWKENLAVGMREAKIGGEHCPMCNATKARPQAKADCRKCPVMQKTGEQDCQGSPWASVMGAVCAENETRFRLAAQREIDFLQSLLPESEAPDAQ